MSDEKQEPVALKRGDVGPPPIALVSSSGMPIRSLDHSQPDARDAEIARLREQLAEYDRRIVAIGVLAMKTAVAPGNYHDAYRGARDDLLDWKRRAEAAEAKLADADRERDAMRALLIESQDLPTPPGTRYIYRQWRAKVSDLVGDPFLNAVRKGEG